MENASPISSRSARVWALLRRVFYPEYLTNRKVRLTRMGMIYLALVVVIAAAALNTGNNLLYLILSMMLAAMLFTFTVSEYMVGEIKLTREVAATVTEDQDFTVTYALHNPNRLTPALALRIHENLGLAAATAMAAYVPAGASVRVRALISVGGRGNVSFTDSTLATIAPFGWFRKTRRVRLPGQVLVLPRVDPALAGRERLAALGDERPQGKRGRGDELFGFRDYAPGDAARDLHWKTSARVGRLMVKEREQEEERKLRIVLDLPGEKPTVLVPSREQAVRQAASLAAEAVNQGWLVRIERDGKGVDFGSGPAHLHLILIFLALFDDPHEPAGTPLPASDAPAVVMP